ncbi:hypothetical protein A9Q81_05465 [Gammaproteobacteria bacterium 42_54_T18]|nr:hypothetical protein A9Q81_05465 [Gammaproteobacteria bacterium 42_54_T18]
MIRLRYENVEVDDKVDTTQDGSDAITLKTRATYTSGDFNGFGMTLEFDDVTSLKSVNYPDKVNSGESGPTIADPEGTGVNQVYISYKAMDTTAKYGRQRILIGNQRFVGGVGWRQNEQTYDALSVSNNSIKNLTVFAAHVYNVDGITGTNTDHDTNLLNIAYKTPIGKATTYYYDVEDESAEAGSKTLGASFAGKVDAGDAKILFNVEFAKQSENAKTTDYDANYTHIMGGVSIAGITAKLGLESLGADDDAGIGFATPLATKHKFQGWTDNFLATPSTGIDDLYVSVGTKVAGIKLLAVYHNFTTNEKDVAAGIKDGDEHGSEIGFVVAKKLDNGIGLSLKYADFSKGDDALGKKDTTKLWLSSTYKF